MFNSKFVEVVDLDDEPGEDQQQNSFSSDNNELRVNYLREELRVTMNQVAERDELLSCIAKKLKGANEKYGNQLQNLGLPAPLTTGSEPETNDDAVTQADLTIQWLAVATCKLEVLRQASERINAVAQYREQQEEEVFPEVICDLCRDKFRSEAELSAHLVDYQMPPQRQLHFQEQQAQITFREKTGTDLEVGAFANEDDDGMQKDQEREEDAGFEEDIALNMNVGQQQGSEMENEEGLLVTIRTMGNGNESHAEHFRTGQESRCSILTTQRQPESPRRPGVSKEQRSPVDLSQQQNGVPQSHCWMCRVSFSTQKEFSAHNCQLHTQWQQPRREEGGQQDTRDIHGADEILSMPVGGVESEAAVSAPMPEVKVPVNWLKCRYCPLRKQKSFVLQSNLSNHLKTCHPDKVNVEAAATSHLRCRSYQTGKLHGLLVAEQGRWQCLCGKTCLFKHTLNLHIRKYTERHCFKCTYCDKSFLAGADYRKHMTVAHKEPPIAGIVSCSKCGLSYSNISMFAKHSSRAHKRRGQESRGLGEAENQDGTVFGIRVEPPPIVSIDGTDVEFDEAHIAESPATTMVPTPTGMVSGLDDGTTECSSSSFANPMSPPMTTRVPRSSGMIAQQEEPQPSTSAGCRIIHIFRQFRQYPSSSSASPINSKGQQEERRGE